MFEYIYKDSPTNAEKFISDIENKIQQISNIESSCPKYKEYKDIYKIVFKNYIILFGLKADEMTILTIYSSKLSRF
ncbi:type II toxin-antitoxin system RelE/ParE family toxin [Campylobacter sp.]|uniref:type II toxin-antitoxin system RelE/ParE family toxin n=1 Tax=Campylobacter sp. TaxID=205 RepID=UPI0034DB5036